MIEYTCDGRIKISLSRTLKAQTKKDEFREKKRIYRKIVKDQNRE